MSEERLNKIKENVYTRCSVAYISGIGMTAPDKEEVELIEEIERLNNIINGVEDLLKRFKCSYSEIPIQIVLNEIRELKGDDKE